jgi:hypothetical protein
MRHQYTITKQYTRGPEISLDERFNNFNEAKTFVEKKLADDFMLNVKIIYRIFEDDRLHSEYDPSKIDMSAKQTSEEATSKGSKESFRPTPLSTTPRPPGTPPKVWVVDKKDDKKDKKD